MIRTLINKLLAAALLLVIAATAGAQTLDGPSHVCPGEEFAVDWSGPDGSGDVVAIAVPQAPADEVFHAKQTAEGNPALLRAPFVPGIYELRYVQFSPMSILAREEIIVEECGSGSSEDDLPLIAVEARGWQIDHGDQINPGDESPYGPSGFTVDQLCAAAPAVGQVLQMMVAHMEAGMQQAGAPISIDMIESLPGAPNRADIAADIRAAGAAICGDTSPKKTVQPFVITYAYCRMAMYTPTHAMDIHIPVARDGTMSMADHARREVAKMTMHQSFSATSALIGRGWGDNIQMDGPNSYSSHIGYPTQKYDFLYTGGLSQGPAGIPGISNTIKVKNEGTGWFSAQVPGIEIIRLFYHRMSNDVSRDEGAMSFFGGLINNLVGMLRKGVPLVMDQTTSSSVLGKTMVSGRSQHYITSMRLVEFTQEWCDQTLMPPGYTVMDIDAQIAQSMGSAEGTDSEEMAEAMQQYNEALQQMTPEQRAMMEGMGMEALTQQAMGGSANMPGSGAAGGNAPPSSALTTNNPTQSAQLHLNAMGYEVGNTNGDEALLTTIAISQYQAERGLEVTGEVTPELLQRMSAEIDGRQ